MSTTAERLLGEALELSDRDRAELAAQLIDSLDAEVDAGAAEAWDEEIQRRIVELDSGAVTPIPWSEVRRAVLGMN
jgi:putative addiction module component (TIGR02574 family)